MSYTWNFYGIVNQLYLNLKTEKERKKKKRKHGSHHTAGPTFRRTAAFCYMEGTTPHHSDFG